MDFFIQIFIRSQLVIIKYSYFEYFLLIAQHVNPFLAPYIVQ